MKHLTLSALLALPLILLGCASAQRQYERGMQFESRGQFAEAAHYYAQAIRREPELNRMVHGRLRESGRQAIEGYLAEAYSLGQSGRHPEAADRYRDADVIADLGRSVGVEIPVPRRYGELRRDAFDAAIASLLERGHIAHDGGDYQNAVRRYEHAGRYEPDRQQAEDLRESIASARLSWATWHMENGRFRAAFEIAEIGLGVRSRHESAFHQVKHDALAAGTVRLAALPVQRLRGASGEVPASFDSELSLLLDDEYWSHPPLFVQTADPRHVRTVVRRQRGSDPLLGQTHLVALLGRELQADFTVASGTERFIQVTGEERRVERTARFRRGGGSATYTEIRTPTTFRGSLRFEVIDVVTRRVVCSDRIERSAQGPVLRGEYDGDYRQLNLNRDQLVLFTDSGLEEQEQRIHDQLADAFAAAFAERVFACVTSLVP